MGRTVRFAAWLVLLSSVGAAACGGRRSPAEPTGAPSEQARAYLDELIGLMQAHSINRLTIDWSAFRTTVFARAAGARSIPDTYPAIQVALDALGDGHSLYYASTGTYWSREAGGLWWVRRGHSGAACGNRVHQGARIQRDGRSGDGARQRPPAHHHVR